MNDDCCSYLLLELVWCDQMVIVMDMMREGSLVTTQAKIHVRINLPI